MDNTLLIVFAIYLIGILASSLFFYYKEAKLDEKGEYVIEASDISDIVFASFLWPVLLILYIILLPFKVTKKLAIKLKKIKNPKKTLIFRQ